MADPKKVGVITHFYDKIGVGIIKLDGDIKVGDRLKFKGNTTDFEQIVSQMQFDHKDIPEGKAGQEVGVKVDSIVRSGDAVYLA